MVKGVSPKLKIAPSARNLFWILLGLALSLAGYARFLEPNWIEVSYYRKRAPVSRPLKLAHLTDLHTFGMGFKEKKILRLLEAESPDAILVTGDNITPGSNYESVSRVLTKLKAPLGVFVTKGNWEHSIPVEDETQFYRSVGVEFLNNDSFQLDRDVWLVGVDDVKLGRPQLQRALRDVPTGAYKLFLFHSPYYFTEASEFCDLSLSGHTHGGQIKFPLIGAPFLPSGSGRYLEGWYRLNGCPMYVNRGIGTSAIPFRFLARPEIAFLTLEPNGE